MEDRIDRRTGEWTPSNAHFSNSQPDLPQINTITKLSDLLTEVVDSYQRGLFN